jgi:hypothetical protein
LDSGKEEEEEDATEEEGCYCCPRGGSTLGDTGPINLGLLRSWGVLIWGAECCIVIGEWMGGSNTIQGLKGRSLTTFCFGLTFLECTFRRLLPNRRGGSIPKDHQQDNSRWREGEGLLPKQKERAIGVARGTEFEEREPWICLVLLRVSTW